MEPVNESEPSGDAVYRVICLPKQELGLLDLLLENIAFGRQAEETVEYA